MAVLLQLTTLLASASAIALTPRCQCAQPHVRRGSHAVMGMNVASAAKLFLMDAWLKLQMQLDDEMQLYKLPPRQLISSEDDLYTVAEAFPEKVRAQFVGWYQGYKAQVTAPKPIGAGLSEAEVLTIFNRIVDRLILLSRQPFDFKSRHEGIDEPYDYFEFGQARREPVAPGQPRPPEGPTT